MSQTHPNGRKDTPGWRSPTVLVVLIAALIAALIGAAAVIVAAIIQSHPSHGAAGASSSLPVTSSPHAGRSTGTDSDLFSLAVSKGGTLGSVAFSRDGQYLAAGDANGKFYIWRVSSHAHVATMTDPSSRGVTSVAFDRYGLLATGDANGHVYLWPNNRAKALSAQGSSSVRSVAFSPDNKYVAAADANGHIYVWAVGRG